VAVALTSLSHGAGCGCKIPAAALEPIVRALRPSTDPNVLVGPATADDAGVYRLSRELALVQTVDFFTPIVDDPYLFGRIAATNALSDIYAMGANPVTALNLVAYPLETLGPDVLGEILRGGLEATEAAGAAVIGGHSIDDPEPKYGLAVTGTVHPDHILSNAGGKSGDVLVLSKPLGAGAVATALKRGFASDDVLAAAVAVMTTLNDEASAAAISADASAVTDVTGFGLLGHLHELSLASNLAATIDAKAIPAIDGVEELLADDAALAGGSQRNREWAEGFASFDPGVDEITRRLACDAMTSGGLLVAVSPDRAHQLLGTPIGRLTSGQPGTIRVSRGSN